MNGLLFIDDEEGIRRSIVRALRKRPYKVYTARNGDEGIQILKQNPGRIDVVISDYKMPGRDGLSTLTHVGMLNPETTRILLTGYATMETAVHAVNEGIDGFLTKPFDNAELRAKIHEIGVRKRLKQFVSAQVFDIIQKSPEAMISKFNEVSIVFADICDFTSMSRTAAPEKIASFLNEHFFVPMSEIAHEHEGTVDKHIGDSLMVVFGSPVPNRNNAENAVKAAVAMQQKVPEINSALKEEESGFRLSLRIGIATGSAFSGVLGSHRKKEFTSIGTPVNMAARLENKAGKGEILVGENTFSKLDKNILAEQVDPMNLKGFDSPVNVYRIKYQ